MLQPVLTAAEGQAYAAADNALVQRVKFLEQQLGLHNTQTSAATPDSTQLTSMASTNDINPLFDNKMDTLVAQVRAVSRHIK